MKTETALICFWFLTVIVGTPFFAVAQDGMDETGGTQFITQNISGQVETVDWAGSKLVVNVGSRDIGSSNVVSVAVPDSALVVRGEDVISLTSIEMGDEVKIISDVDSATGELSARRIDDMNLANE